MKIKPHHVFAFFSLFFCVQFQTTAGCHGESNAQRGEINGRTSGQTQRPAAVLPVYMTQDRLTLVVLTLLLGGWLAIALTFPIVSVFSICLSFLQVLFLR